MCSGTLYAGYVPAMEFPPSDKKASAKTYSQKTSPKKNHGFPFKRSDASCEGIGPCVSNVVKGFLMISVKSGVTAQSV